MPDHGSALRAPRQLLTVVVIAYLFCSCGVDGESSRPSPGAEETAALPTETLGNLEATRRDPDLPWNVVLVTLDTTRADSLGAYSPNQGATPRLDALAAEGILFENAATSSPSTLPSHSTIFTGKQPFAHGARSNHGYVLVPEHVTLAEALAEAGYATRAEIAAVALRPDTGVAQGFQQITHAGSSGVKLKRKLLNEGGEAVQFPIRTATDIADHGIQFIRSHRDSAFFLWLHFFDAHKPYAPPPEFLRRFPGDAYRASVAYQDSQVGRVLDAIDVIGLREHTLVVVTADHGESLGEHGVENHSYYIFESTMRVPLIVRGPTPIAGRRHVEALVRTTDIPATILDLAGHPPLNEIDGVTLRPLLDGSRQDLALTAYGESLELQGAFGILPLRSLREGSWKYIHKVEPELYDLRTDPHELTNLAAQEPARVAEMSKRLREMVITGSDAPAGANAEVDAETRAQLLALGYASSAPRVDDEAASLDLTGPDATDFIPKVKLLAKAQGDLLARDFGSAHEGFTKLLADHPEGFELSRLTATTLEGLGRFEEAAERLESLAGQRPDDVGLLLAWARNLAKAGRRDEAIPVWERALEIEPCDPARQQMYLAAYESADSRRQFDVLADGMERCPESPGALIDFAWVLATIPDDTLRDGARALELAQRGISMLDGPPDPAQLDTLAAAYAETGEFERAIAEQRKALAMLSTQGVPFPVQTVFRSHLAEFEAGRALRDP